jgi:ATP-binding protein involved in chromosome partitioning
LAEIPLTIGIREQGDAGSPIVVAKPDSPEAEAFLGLADRVIEAIEARQVSARTAPRITFE